MNPNQCRLELRPRDPLESFDLLFRVLREWPGPFIRLAVWWLGPAWLVWSAGCWFTEGDPALALALFVFAPMLQAPFTIALARRLFSEELRIRDVIRDLLSRIVPLIGLWFVLWLGGLLTIFWPLLQLMTLFATEAIVLERASFSTGLRRSFRLVMGQFGTALAGMFAWWVLTLWFAVIGEAVGQLIVDGLFQLGEPFGNAMDGKLTPWSIGGMVAAQGVYSLYRLLLYVDTRTRAEGWDLQVALRAAGLKP